jgi:hypothetical protein
MMANSKKSSSKSTAKSSSKSSDNKSTNKVEARPIGEGKDPLAEGERLHNPTNTEAETHYEADRSELNDEERASKIRGKNANERAREHNAESPADVEDKITEKAQELHEEVTNRTEEEQAEESARRDEAVTKAFNKESK